LGKRGRGATKVQQGGIIRKVGDEHDVPVIRLPKSLLNLGLKLNQEVVIVANPSPNFLDWEITIKPLKPIEHKHKPEEEA